MGNVRFFEGPAKLPTQRVYRFSEDLHTQKLLLSKILRGDTIQHRPELVREVDPVYGSFQGDSDLNRVSENPVSALCDLSDSLRSGSIQNTAGNNQNRA